MVPRRTRATVWFWIAAAFSIAHAIPSFYWAFGGTLLLETVGQWAVSASRDQPELVTFGLFVVGGVKLAAALIPLLADRQLLPLEGLWRGISWVGGPILMLYAALNMIGAVISLAGWVDVAGADHTALWSRLLLWEPLFFAWGAALTWALICSRRSREPLK